MTRNTYLTRNYLDDRSIDKALAKGYGKYREVMIVKRDGSMRLLQGLVNGIHGGWLIREPKGLRKVPMRRVISIDTKPWYNMTVPEFLEDNCE